MLFSRYGMRFCSPIIQDVMLKIPRNPVSSLILLS